jgi:hypothetical protein
LSVVMTDSLPSGLLLAAVVDSDVMRVGTGM